MLTAAQQNLREGEKLLSQLPGAEDRLIVRLAAPAGSGHSLGLDEIQAGLTRYGQMIQGLRNSSAPDAPQKLRAVIKLYGALEDTLDQAYSSLRFSPSGVVQWGQQGTLPEEAQAALNFARQSYRKLATVGDLEDLAQQSISQKSGVPTLDAGQMYQRLTQDEGYSVLRKHMQAITLPTGESLYDRTLGTLQQLIQKGEGPR